MFKSGFTSDTSANTTNSYFTMKLKWPWYRHKHKQKDQNFLSFLCLAYAWVYVGDLIYSLFNRPFTSSLVPLFQNESKWETIHMKMSPACRFISMQIKVIFAARLALKQRHKKTRKWSTAFNGIDMSRQLVVRVSDQHESLCYFGHWAYLILAIYCYLSFLFLINLISINTVKVTFFVNSVKQ